MSMKSSYSGYWVIDGGGLDNSSGKLPCAELFGELQCSPAQPIF